VSSLIIIVSPPPIPPGLIFKINLLLENYDVVKARVKFAFKNNKQRLVAECRRLFHHVFDGGTKLFGPGLSFHKDIHNKIGGYFFDERIDWGEDGELSSRIYEANLNYYIVNDCLFHDEENILHDLSVAWRIGRGSRQKNKNKKDFFLEILEVNWHDPKNRIQIAYSEGGYSLAIYFFTWRVMTYLGYYFGKKRGV